MKISTACVACIVCMVLMGSVMQAQYQVPRSVFGCGGIEMNSPAYRVTGTVGQSVIGISNGTAHSQRIGFWYSAALTTSVEQIPGGIPGSVLLEQNYPNPFNPSTTITFYIPSSAMVEVKVLNSLGMVVETLVETQLSAGTYSTTFVPLNLPSGVYVCVLKYGERLAQRTMVLMK